MAKDRKTVLKGFDYRQCDDFASYLERMAADGWHFKEWGAGLVFEKGAPEETVYAVEVFTDGTEYDTRPEPKTKEFAEYCEAAGWQFVDAKRKFCIFKRIHSDAVPIMTDEERLESIAKATRPEIWRTLLIALMFTAMRLADYSIAFERYIFSDMQLMVTVVWSLLLIISLLRCGLHYLWKHRCRRRIAEGQPLFFGKGRLPFTQEWHSWLTSFIVLAQLAILVLLGQTRMVVFYAVVIGAMVLMGVLIAKFRPDALSNQIIQLLGSTLIFLFSLCFCMGVIFWETEEEKSYPTPPLTYADIGIDLGQPELRYADQLDGVFGSWHYFNLDYGADYLFYYVYESQYDWALDKIWQCETDGKANETREDYTGDWGAEEAFRNGGNDYLVRYENMILILSPSVEEPLMPEQIDIIREKLDLR